MRHATERRTKHRIPFLASCVLFKVGMARREAEAARLPGSLDSGQARELQFRLMVERQRTYVRDYRSTGNTCGRHEQA
jgi:hypothetical protein